MKIEKNRIFAIIAGVIILIADQAVKYVVWLNMCPDSENFIIGRIKVIPGVFHITYSENTGAVFGSFAGYTALLSVFTALILLVGIAVLLFWKMNSKLMCWSLTLVVFGGIGNLTDRVMRGFVIDFIDVCIVWPYIFNIADSAVVIGVCLIILNLLLDTIKEAKKKKQVS